MEPTPQPTEQKLKKQRNIFIGGFIALAILSAVMGGFLMNENKEKTIVIEEKTALEGDFRNVSDSLDAESVRLSMMKGRNEELDKIIEEKQASIEQQKAELTKMYEENTLTAEALNRARRTISQHEQSINKLQTQVQEYAAQNTQLTQHNEKLTADLTCEQETNTTLTATNQVLGAKVEAGSYFQLAKVNVEAVKRKNNGTEVAVEKAKAAENIKVSFETGVNKVVDPGQIPLYVRIINPRGETLSVSEQGSGIIPESENGKPVKYTKKTSVQYNQTNKKVVLYWSRYINDPGTYRVEVYQNGKVIGKGAVQLT